MNRLSNSAASALLSLLSSLCAVGCADARGRFESFERRARNSPDSAAAGSNGTQGTVDESYDAGPCLPPGPNTVTGPALLAFDTNSNAGLPILFLGTISTPALSGTTAVHFVYRALDSLDRTTRVGDELEVGPYPLENGVLMARVPETTLDGAANPVLHGVPLTSSLTLYGHICGIRPFYCGTLDGQLSGVLSGPVTGHFGITLLAGPDAVPDRPRFGCGVTDIAAPLAR